MSHLQQRSDDILAMYATRAKSYDEGDGGWHIELGHDFVEWLAVEPGERALDLACGTGLVTIPLAERLGPTGVVVGVDMTAEMIQMGRDKVQALSQTETFQQAAPIDWVVGDIIDKSLLDVPSIKKTVIERGGFDIISVCSALVLLPDASAVIQFWASSLLRRGGRMIVDVPTEALSSQFLFTYHIPATIGLPTNLAQQRLFVKDSHSLEDLYESAGLTIDTTIRTKSYVGETWYDEGKAIEVFEKKGISKYLSRITSDKSEEARNAWLRLWPSVLTRNEEGQLGFRDGHWLYVTIGTKV